MKNKQKYKGQLISTNPISGKIRKERIDAEMEDFMSDEGIVISTSSEVSR